MADIVNQGRDSLTTPMQKVRYDNATRSYVERYVMGRADTHYNTQRRSIADETNKATLENAYNAIARSGMDETAVHEAIGVALNSALKQMSLDGTSNQPAMIEQRKDTIVAGGYRTWAESVFSGDPAQGMGPAAALKIINDHKRELETQRSPYGGTFYDELYKKFHAAATTDNATRRLSEIGAGLDKEAAKNNGSYAGVGQPSAGPAGAGAAPPPIPAKAEWPAGAVTVARSATGQPLFVDKDGALLPDDKQPKASVAAGQAESQGREPPTTGASVAHPTQTGDIGVDQGASLIRSREGFRSNAYWDSNHWRVGFGSDTVTKPDGSVESVGPNTTVSQADAQRDLVRRTRETQNKIAAEIGYDRWQALSPGARAALTSMSYNYGLLPYDVQSAARGGGPEDIARMIEGHAGDNGGVNRTRRMQEASIVLGGAIPSGFASSFGGGGGNLGGPSESLMAPGLEDAPPPAPPAPPPAAPEPPAYPGQPPPEQPADQGVVAETLALQAAQRHDAMVRGIYLSDDDKATKDAMLKQENEAYAMVQAGLEANSKTMELQKKEATNRVYNLINQEKYPEAIRQATQEVNAGHISQEEWHTIKDSILKEMKQGDDRDMGPHFHDVQGDILSGRINDNISILQAYNAGAINKAGKTELISELKERNEEVGGDGRLALVHASLAEGLRAVKFSQDFGSSKIPDEHEDEYAQKFTKAWYAEYNKWRREGQKGEFPGFDSDHILALAHTIRPPASLERDHLLAQSQSGLAVTGRPPEQIDPATVVDGGKTYPSLASLPRPQWQFVVGSPPTGIDGKRYTTDAWAVYVARLAANPYRGVVAAFDQKFIGHSGAGILGVLGIPIRDDIAGPAPDAASPDIAAPLPGVPMMSPLNPGFVPAAAVEPPQPPPPGWVPTQSGAVPAQPVFAAPSYRIPEKEKEGGPAITVGKPQPRNIFNSELWNDIEALRKHFSAGPHVSGEELRQKLLEQQRSQSQ